MIKSYEKSKINEKLIHFVNSSPGMAVQGLNLVSEYNKTKLFFKSIVYIYLLNTL